MRSAGKGIGLWAVVVAMVVIGSAGIGGCASHYVRGRQTRLYFVQQRVNPRGATGSPGGLDSEEAALIHARYRQSMAPEGYAGRTEGSDVLVIREDGGTVREANRGRNR